MPKKTVTIQYVQDNIDECLDWVNETKGQIYVLDEEGAPSTVLISYDEGVMLGILNANTDGDTKSN